MAEHAGERSTTPADRTATVAPHALVLGAGLAGLAAAAALADRFDRVTIVERDVLDESETPRHGVPQGRHAHVLLPGGLHHLDDLLPGFVDDLRLHGVHVIDATEFRFWVSGGRLALDGAAVAIPGATRPVIERIVRQRVTALPGVRVLDGHEVVGLDASADGGRVTGARVRRRAGDGAAETIGAALVVDATGRAGRAPRWLADLGYPEPAEERFQVGVHYATRLFTRTPSDLDGCRHVVVAVPPGEQRGGLVLTVDDDRWLVTLVGTRGERPPGDLLGFAAYARSLWRPEVRDVVAGGQPVGEPSTGAFPFYLRRRYDRLARFPQGYVVTGDAACSLNPLYAQGMSVAIREAAVLARVIDRHGLDRIGPRVFRRARPVVDAAWTLATGADLADPGVDGRRPLRWRAVNAYMERLVRVAHRDPVVANAVFEVNALLAPPPRVMRPAILGRVLRGGRTATRQPAGAEEPTVTSDVSSAHDGDA